MTLLSNSHNLYLDFPSSTRPRLYSLMPREDSIDRPRFRISHLPFNRPLVLSVRSHKLKARKPQPTLVIFSRAGAPPQRPKLMCATRASDLRLIDCRRRLRMCRSLFFLTTELRDVNYEVALVERRRWDEQRSALCIVSSIDLATVKAGRVPPIKGIFKVLL